MDGMNLEVAYSQLNKKAQAQLRNKVIRRCGWKSRTTFYNKIYGNVSIPKLERQVIEEELKKESIKN
ncbi:MAG: hypothetical protein ACERIH_00215 [Labilibaculum antarcticum]